MPDPDKPVSSDAWQGPDGELGRYISEQTEKTLRSYQAQPKLVANHANEEVALVEGGYTDRQILELVQNSTDSLAGKEGGGRIRVRLTREYLYCADEGLPIGKDGIDALMFAYMSNKWGTDQIGRFGLGFKSVLGVTDRPEFYSRSGSFYFDRSAARS